MQKSNVKSPKELPMPKPGLIHSEKFRIGIGSAVAASVVLFLSFYLSEFYYFHLAEITRYLHLLL